MCCSLFFNKCQRYRTESLLKRNSSTGAILRILQKFLEQLFGRELNGEETINQNLKIQVVDALLFDKK